MTSLGGTAFYFTALIVAVTGFQGYQLRSETSTFQFRSDSSTDKVPITEAGYNKVTLLQSDDVMKKFVRRVLDEQGQTITSEVELSGFVPWYSGSKATQSLQRMRDELSVKPWVVKKSAVSSSKDHSKNKHLVAENKNAARKAEADVTSKVAIHEAKTSADAKNFAIDTAKKVADDVAKKIADDAAKNGADHVAKENSTVAAKQAADDQAKAAAKKRTDDKIAVVAAKKGAVNVAEKTASEAAKKIDDDVAKKIAIDEAKKLAEAKKFADAKKGAADEAKKIDDDVAKKIAIDDAKKLAEAKKFADAKKGAADEAKKTGDTTAKKTADDVAKKGADDPALKIVADAAKETASKAFDKPVEESAEEHSHDKAKTETGVAHKSAQNTTSESAASVANGTADARANKSAKDFANTSAVSVANTSVESVTKQNSEGFAGESEKTAAHQKQTGDEVEAEAQVGNPHGVVSKVKSWFHGLFDHGENKESVNADPARHADIAEEKSSMDGVAQTTADTSNADNVTAENAAANASHEAEEKTRADDASVQTVAKPSLAFIANDSETVVVESNASKSGRHRKHSGKHERASDESADHGRHNQPSNASEANGDDTCTSKIRTFQFRPGILGIGADWTTGTVMRRLNRSQAMEHGVQRGWVITRLNGKSYSEELLGKLIAGSSLYTISFKVPCGSESRSARHSKSATPDTDTSMKDDTHHPSKPKRKVPEDKAKEALASEREIEATMKSSNTKQHGVDRPSQTEQPESNGTHDGGNIEPKAEAVSNELAKVNAENTSADDDVAVHLSEVTENITADDIVPSSSEDEPNGSKKHGHRSAQRVVDDRLPSAKTMLHKQTHIVGKLQEHLAELKGQLEEKESTNRAKAAAKKAFYEAVLQRARQNTTAMRQKNKFLLAEIEELSRNNSELRGRAERIRRESLLLQKELRDVQVDLTTALEFLDLSVPTDVDPHHETIVLREMEEEDRENKRERLHKMRLEEIRKSRLALLQVDGSDEGFDEEDDDDGDHKHKQEGSLDALHFVSSIGDTIGDFDREQEAGLKVLQDIFRAELKEERKQQALVARDRVDLEERKDAELKLKERLMAAVAHMIKTKALLTEEIVQLREYTKKVSGE